VKKNSRGMGLDLYDCKNVTPDLPSEYDLIIMIDFCITIASSADIVIPEDGDIMSELVSALEAVSETETPTTEENSGV